MEADGIVRRKVYHEVPPKVKYSLTVFGVSLNEALTPLCEWGSNRANRKKLTSCYPQSMAGLPKALTPKTCKRRRRCWRS